MNADEKRAYLLLKSVIFHYHGLDEEEQRMLEETAKNMNALAELAWVMDFIAADYYSAYDRARDYLKGVMNQLDKERRLSYLRMVWNANNKKGYISEMEALAIIQLAKDWGIAPELIEMIKNNPGS
jgi:uncharacterized tellurite resistance protein B-like protein